MYKYYILYCTDASSRMRIRDKVPPPHQCWPKKKVYQHKIGRHKVVSKIAQPDSADVDFHSNLRMEDCKRSAQLSSVCQ
jgi:hypothetical protein